MRFTVGVAFSHGAAPGAHEYWLASVGTARNPFGDFVPPAEVNLPRLESLSPSYQCYPIAGPVAVRPVHEKAPLEAWEQSTNATQLQFETRLPLLGIHPRPQAAGFAQDRPWRWEPLLGAYATPMPEQPRASRGLGRYSGPFTGLLDPEEVGDYRGAVGALLVHVKPPFLGSVWACFTPVEPEFYQQALVSHAVRQVLARMQRGVFLVEAGTDQARADFPSLHEHRAGARVANFGRSPSSNLVVRVYRSFEPGFYAWRKPPDAQPGQIVSCPMEDDRLTAPPSYEHSLVLYHLCQEQFENDDRMPLDRVLEPLRYSFDQPPPFVRIENGGFTVNGVPWKAHGVNYMPSSGIGITGDYFEHWLGRGVIRESELCQQMGARYIVLTPDILPPDNRLDQIPPAVEEFLGIMDDERNYPVLLHCRAGLHRTGRLTAIYRMEYENWSVGEALRELRANGYGFMAASEADDFVVQFIQNYRRRAERNPPVAPYPRKVSESW